MASKLLQASRHGSTKQRVGRGCSGTARKREAGAGDPGAESSTTSQELARTAPEEGQLIQAEGIDCAKAEGETMPPPHL